MARGVASTVLMVVLSASGAAAIQSTFDTDLEGWTTDNTGAFTHQASGGNPAGFLQLDNDEAGLAHVVAPAAFHGNLLALDGTTLAFDGQLVTGGGSFYQSGDDYGVVRISGGGTSAQLDLLPSGTTAPLGTWATFSVPFTAASFGVTPQTWNTILGDVTEVRLTIEALFGSEVEGIDNFCIAEVCSSGSTTTSTSTSTTSSSTTSVTIATTSTTSSTTSTLPSSCELLDATKLELRSKTGKEKQRGITLLSEDTELTVGGGTGSADDPVLHGGTLRVVSAAGDGFDDTYPLPADRWKPVKRKGGNVGFKFRRTNPIKGIEIKTGEHLRVRAAGLGLGHTLEADPDPVDVVLTIGGHCYCLHFGRDTDAEVTFKAGKRWLAKGSGTGPCPAPASP